jgi:hypothetical protein
MLLVSLVLFSSIVGENTSNYDKERSIIKTVIVDAYIKGIHVNRDPAAIRKGFHPEFNIIVLRNDKITKVPLAKWIEKIESLNKENSGASKIKTTHRFLFIDVIGNAATAKIEVYKDSKLESTNYMSLYKFKNGWKIVSKIFHWHY